MCRQVWLTEAARIAPKLLLLISQLAKHLLYVAIYMEPGLCRGLLKGVGAAQASQMLSCSSTQSYPRRHPRTAISWETGSHSLRETLLLHLNNSSHVHRAHVPDALDTESYPENGWRAPAPVTEGLPSRCSGADSMRMRPGGLAVENGDGANGDCCGPRYTMLCNRNITSSSVVT